MIFLTTPVLHLFLRIIFVQCFGESATCNFAESLGTPNQRNIQMAHQERTNLPLRRPVDATTVLGNTLWLVLLGMASMIQAFLLVTRTVRAGMMTRTNRVFCDHGTRRWPTSWSPRRIRFRAGEDPPVGAAARVIEASSSLDWRHLRSHDPPRHPAAALYGFRTRANAGALARDGPIRSLGRGAINPGNA